jgi:hypothetical protein
MAYQETDGTRVCARYDRLKAERATFESTWQEIAEVIRPLRAEFTATRSAGEKRNQKIFDSTPLMAADNFAGGIYGMMTSPSNRWFSLKLEGDEQLAEFGPVRDWLYSVTTIILNSFGPEYSRFYNVIPALYSDLACFGNAVFYSEEQEGSRRINDGVRALSEVVFAENEYGEVDTVYRRFAMDARNVVNMYPDTVSEETKKIAEKNPYEKVWIIHCVEPNPEFDPERALVSKPFHSIYVEQQKRRELSRSGYWEMPYQVPRWSQAAGETYGRGLGEIVIADVKTLNQQSRTSLVSAQKAADPPLLAPDEGVIRQARTYPGGITYGGVDANGNPLLRPLMQGADHRLTFEMMEQRRSSIREGFYFSLMQMVGSPDMTATEWIGRQEEKLRLLGPNLGRIQSEFLSPLVSRRFGMLNRMGLIPTPPEELQGRKVQVDYVSPLARAQMAGEAQAVVRLYQSIEPMANIDQSILDNIDHDQALNMLAKGWAVPAPVMRGKAEVAEIREVREKNAQMAQAIQLGQMAGNTVKNVAQGGREVAAAENQRAQAKKAGGTPSSGGGADMTAAIEMMRKALSGGRSA